MQAIFLDLARHEVTLGDMYLLVFSIGRQVDDFYYERAPRQVHVLNAPSPAATASLEIAKRIADELEV